MAIRIMNASEIAKQYGPQCESAFAKSLLNQWNQTVKSAEKHPKVKWRKSPPNLHVYLVSNEEMNAFAQKSDDGYAIVVFDGLVKVVGNLFLTLLADPRTYPAIGASTEEKQAPESSTVYYSLIERMIEGDLREPIDPYRAEFALHMAELALRFAFSHELYHVLLGHVDLYSDSRPLFEIGPRVGGCPRNHATEMHADQCAFRSCIYWILDSIHGIELSDPMTFYMNTIDAQLLDFFAATYTLFQVFDAVDSQAHPNPVHRQTRLGLTLNYIAQYHELKLDHPVMQIIGTVINNVDLDMEEVLGVDWSSRRKETDRLLTTDIKTELSRYSDEIYLLYSDLEPHAFIDVQ